MIKAYIKRIADASLAAAFVGTMAAYPFQHTFAGGLLFAGFSAATIGGIADSFAVSALFRHPLRIPWPRFMGTRVIPRNRERLINEVVNMVQHELLSIPNIYKKLDSYHVAGLLMHYLQERGGRAEVERLLQQFMTDALYTVDLSELAAGLQSFLLDQAERWPVSDTVADIGEWTIKNGYDERIIDFFIMELIRLVRTNEFRTLAEQLIASAIESYEAGKRNRKFVNAVAGIQADQLSGIVQQKIIALLQQLQSPEHPNHIRLKEQIAAFVTRLREDEQLRDRVEAIKLALIATAREQFQLWPYLERWLESYRKQDALRSGDFADVFPRLHQLIGDLIEKLARDEASLDRLDTLIKKNAMKWLERKHDSIGKLVRDGLSRFSEEQLLEFVHDKAGHDLQFIRLNGTFVGGLIGIVLYLATFWVGR
ncbi:DUF445 domain-containing protein [Paenibacillus sp. GCM10027626]|uniref:DUF445 domain-containing protein n=1 Tax=Paenibacillus sp. GCM10027626 TaxID=3273411 RepID=UPI003632C760